MMKKEYWTKGGMLRHNLLAMRDRLEHKRMISAILKDAHGIDNIVLPPGW